MINCVYVERKLFSVQTSINSYHIFVKKLGDVVLSLKVGNPIDINEYDSFKEKEKFHDIKKYDLI